MVVSPYSTLFVSPQNTSLLRSETSVDSNSSTKPGTPQSESDREKKPQSPRPVFEANPISSAGAAFEPASVFEQVQTFTLNDENEAPSQNNTVQDAPEQFDKVQTFLQVQSFEDTPHLIDTFV